ncbi:plastocyanin/azurin family copper-binding protein [Deinococcus radiopugnans]|uniref:cupredoxin domain-containing protein n=1 Tax=Deinococcus radiopugnans TaxID=57497 RepID=UPI00361F077A
MGESRQRGARTGRECGRSGTAGDAAAGGRASVTFPETGNFVYRCLPHPFMTGTVQVQ